jgi:hypothetical protein
MGRRGVRRCRGWTRGYVCKGEVGVGEVLVEWSMIGSSLLVASSWVLFMDVSAEAFVRLFVNQL